jgi:predicted PurR-regulated permease PerM
LDDSEVTTPQHAFRSGFFALTGAAVALLCLYILYIGGQAVLAIATPFLAGGICALLIDPVVVRLEQIHRITRGKRSIAVAISGIGFLLLFAALIILIVPVLVAQVRALLDWVTSDGPAELQAWGDTWLASHRTIGPFALPATLQEVTNQYSEQLTTLARRYGTNFANAFIGGVGNVLQLVLVPIVTFTLLSDLPKLRARLLFLLPESSRLVVVDTLREIGGIFGNYLRGMVQVSLLYGIIATAALLLMSVFAPGIRSYALLVGVVAGVLFAVPYVGFLGTALLTVTVGVIGHIPFAWVGAEIGLLLTLNTVFDNVITPRIVGGGIGLHPLLAMLALLLGASLFGLVGMLIGVPVAGSLQAILLKRFPKLSAPTSDEVYALAEHLAEPVGGPKHSQGNRGQL